MHRSKYIVLYASLTVGIIQIGLILVSMHLLRFGYWESVLALQVLMLFVGGFLALDETQVTLGSCLNAALAMLITPVEYLLTFFGITGNVPVFYGVPALAWLYISFGDIRGVTPIVAFGIALLFYILLARAEYLVSKHRKQRPK